MTRRFFIAIILILTLCANVGAQSPKREWRSTWLATVANIDWPRVRGTSPEIIAQQKQGMIDYLDGLKMMNMNAICFQVRSMCDAMYETINEKLRNHFYNDADVAALLDDREKRVLANQQSSFTAARDVLDFYFKKI